MAEANVVSVNSVSVSAQDLRNLLSRPLGEGVDGYDDMRVTPSSGLVLSVAGGVGYVRGDSVGDQGLYRVYNDAAKLTSAFALGGIAAAHATNPRLDQIVARVYDEDALDQDLRTWRLEVIGGTATGGATLDNRNGADALPPSAMLLADVLVPASAASLGSSDIRDRRPFSSQVSVANALATPAARDQVPLINQGVPLAFGSSFFANAQRYHAHLLPRRIVGATRIRLPATFGGAGNMNVAIYDASGRKIVETGSVAKSTNPLTIAATTFEAGLYWVGIGVDGTAATGSFIHDWYSHGSVPSLQGAVSSGGLTLPTTLAAITNNNGTAFPTGLALSVG